MKPQTYYEYNREDSARAECALLTTWRCLDDYHDDLVLVGGMAIRYLTDAPSEGVIGAITLDVDFGINVGVSSGTFPQIEGKLHEKKFKWKQGRFCRNTPEMDLYLDLLTDDDKSSGGTTTIDDSLHVSIVPGVRRALECHKLVEVTGMSLDGEQHSEMVRVADVGPMLVLKLNAFDDRGEPKDAHDILYLAMNYKYGGVEAAIAGFHAERAAGNRGMDQAMRCLGEQFASRQGDAASLCAEFRFAGSGSDDSEQIAELFMTLAHELLR